MRAFVRFNQGLLRMPIHLQAWVLLLVGLNIVTPLFFLERVEAQAALAAGVASLGLMTALTGRFGFSRIVGLGHVTWIPLVAFLATRLGDVPATDAFGLWLRAIIAADIASLVMDTIDVRRFVAGDRADTVAGLAK